MPADTSATDGTDSGSGGFGLPRWIARLAAGALPIVGHDARGDPHQPCDEGHTPPLELSDAHESFAEDIGRQVLGLMPVADPPNNVAINAIKVLLVQVGKAGGVALGRLDLRLFVMLLAHG